MKPNIDYFQNTFDIDGCKCRFLYSLWDPSVVVSKHWEIENCIVYCCICCILFLYSVCTVHVINFYPSNVIIAVIFFVKVWKYMTLWQLRKLLLFVKCWNCSSQGPHVHFSFFVIKLSENVQVKVVFEHYFRKMSAELSSYRDQHFKGSRSEQERLLQQVRGPSKHVQELFIMRGEGGCEINVILSETTFFEYFRRLNVWISKLS